MSVRSNTKKVSRRNVLKRGAISGGAAAAAIGFPQVSRAETATLKMQTSWGPNEIFQHMARQYVERVEKMGGGRLKIDLLSVKAVVNYNQVQDACHKGALDAAHTVTAYWYGKNRAASLFGTGPVFGANAAQILAWIHFGGGKELYRELVQDILKLNLVGFFSMPMPTQPLGWFKKEISKIEDMQGLKYRTVGLATNIMQGIGMKVVAKGGNEVFEAMETGVIDAFEYNNPTADREMNAHDLAKYYMLGSYHQAAEFFEIIFNKGKFESLPEEHRAILEYGAEAASTANYGLAMDRYSKDLQWFMKDSGVKVTRTSPSIMEAQLKSWDKVLKNLEKDPFFKKVVESQKAWSRRVAFYDILNSADYKLAYQHYFPGAIDF